MSPKVLETTHVAGGAWTAGHNQFGPWAYMGGGAGYVLGRQTVKELVENVLPICFNDQHVSWEDVFLSKCMQKHLNITLLDTQDDEGADRFIQYDPVIRAFNPGNYVTWQGRLLNKRYNLTSREGLDSVSSSAISFHKVKPPVKMRRYERIFYRMQDQDLDRGDCGSEKK